METRKDIYERVTNQILEALERGTPPWRNSFEFIPVNAFSKHPYRGINVLLLWESASTRGFKDYQWATYKQWQDIGAQVRKGETATSIVFWKFDEDIAEEDEDTGRRRVPLARGYSVFNAAQVDGYQAEERLPVSSAERIDSAESFFSSIGADICEDIAPFYRLEDDSVHMPPLSMFCEAGQYYSILAHEITHWTGAPHRLNRNLGTRFGSRAYAAEELIAELGAAFLCADLSLSSEPRKEHASYIATWIELLSNDKRALFTASSKAQQAVDWMHGGKGNTGSLPGGK